MLFWDKKTNKLFLHQDDDYLRSDYLEKCRYTSPARMFDITKWRKWWKEVRKDGSKED